MRGKLNIGDLVLLTWHDIHEDSSWREDDGDTHGVSVCQSIGWVTKVTRKVVTLTRTYGSHPGQDERKPGDAISFPRGCIEKVEVLRVAQKD